MKNVLVLSSAFEPLAVIGWKKAMSLWIEGKVDVVSSYEDQFVHTVNEAFALPAVIRHTGKVRKRWRNRTIRFNRRNVFTRDGGICAYCGDLLSFWSFTYDHVVPRSRGGTTDFKNIVAACRPCNRVKADRTPDEAGMKLGYKPFIPTHLASLDGGIPACWAEGMPEQWRDWI